MKSLSYAKIATVKLQREQLTIDDFHGIWIECYYSTNELNSVISVNMCKAMDTREKILFSNVVYSAGNFFFSE